MSGVSFCVITDGRRPALLQDMIASIRALALPAWEVIVAGNVPSGLGDDVRVLHAPELALAGRLGAMRNLACRSARFDQLVVSDDDMHFHPELAEVLTDRDPAVDVMCVRLLNPDGTRYWDWATHGGPRGHTLLSYDETDDHVYVTGGLAIMWARVHEQVPWDDARGFYQGEDIEWSSRVHAAGFRIGLDVRGRVTHQDARYTQHGTHLIFRQDLSTRERLAPGIEATGVFREDVGGVKGCKWMSIQGAVHAPVRTTDQQWLQFVASSIAPALAGEPFGVLVEVNGQAMGVMTFSGTQSIPVRIPLQDHTTLTVRLTSEKGVNASAVGIPDDRPVSVLLHDAQLSPR
ncbi:MAG: hypothetical protein IBJ03_06635 [Gemmatimonadaceae bacterium]|nr:hypothetical protein [Gemmatimonadaceae bacterium]